MGRGDDNILFGDHLAKASRRRPGERESLPREPLKKKEIGDLLYPMIWESSEDIDGKRELNHIKIGGSKSQACQAVAEVLSEERIGSQVASLYARWEEEALETGLYREIVSYLEGREEMIALWGRLLCSPTRENRSYALRNHIPALTEEKKKDLLLSLPEPHRLVVKGDVSIRKNPLGGEWSIEAIKVDSMGLF